MTRPIAGVLAVLILVHCQHVEGKELHLLIMPAGMQGVEFGIAVDAQDVSLAIYDKVLLLMTFSRRLSSSEVFVWRTL
jgi:hypothetical protein